MSRNIRWGWNRTQPPSKDITINLNSPQARGLLVWIPLVRHYSSTAPSTLLNYVKRTPVGTKAGTITWLYDQALGPYLRGAGAGSYYNFGDPSSFDALSQITLSVWVKKADAWGQDLFWAKHTSSTNGCFFIGTTSSTNLRFTLINASSSRVDHDYSLSPATNTWYHIAAVYNGANMSTYVNGKLTTAPSAQTGLIKDHTSALRLFNFNGDSWEFNGDIAEPRIYNRALSASEIRELYDPATRWDLYKPIAPAIWYVPAAAPTPPDGDPTNLALDVVSSSRIDLTWTDGSTNEDGFSIERSTDGTSFAEIDTVAADAESYSDTSCSPNTLYYYRVRAYNGEGYSNYTDTESAKTPPDDVSLQQYLVWDGSQIRQTDYRYVALVDGVPAPDTAAGVAWIYVDEDDGDLKCKFGDGTVTVIAADT